MGLRVLHEEPEFSELFISHLLSRNARVEADLVDQLFNSSEEADNDEAVRLGLGLAFFPPDDKSV